MTWRLIAGFVVFAVSFGGVDKVHAAEETAATEVYNIKASDVKIPADATIGFYRRIVQPFEYWTLICDENLQKKQRVCNITQQIVDSKGGTVFSWSLAGTEGGKPILIIRVPASVGVGQTVRLSTSNKEKPIDIKTKQCTSSICLALQLVGPRLKRYIAESQKVRVSYPVPQSGEKAPKQVVFQTTLAGVMEAFKAIGG